MLSKQKLGIRILMGVLGALLLLIPFAGCAAEEAKKETLIFADTGFDTIHIHNAIAAFILEHGYGYPSESVPASVTATQTGLIKGDIDINMELWYLSALEAYEKSMATGKVLDLGTNYADAVEAWYVPTYMIKGDPTRGIEPMAPDLKSIDDLPKYWELFKDPEDPTKGVFYSCIPGWFCVETNQRKFEAYGLDEYYNIFLPGSDPALSASMIGAYEKGEPWFGYYWEPTWVIGTVDMTRLEEPPYDEEVWEATRGCAYPEAKIIIQAHAGLQDTAPEVVELLENWETTSALNNKILAYMQKYDADAEEAAIYFLQEYESTWTKWVPSDVAEKVKAALP